MSNKLTTKSYCIKRLRDIGYTIDKEDAFDYAQTDERKWSFIIDNGGMSIFITCYKDETMHLYDGGRYTNTNLRLDTDSVEVLAEYLNSRGLIHKHPRYHQRS
jgi:hypothetical protein